MTGWLAKLFVVGTRPSTCKILGTAPSGVLMKEQRTWDWCVHSRQKRLIWKFAKFEQMHFLKSHYCVKKTLKTEFFFFCQNMGSCDESSCLVMLLSGVFQRKHLRNIW